MRSGIRQSGIFGSGIFKWGGGEDIIPPDSSLVDLIYLLLGLTEEDIPRAVVAYFLEQWEQLYPDNECLVLFNTIKFVYFWLMETALAGSVKGRIREKRGRREIEIEESSKEEEWYLALSNFLKAPWNLLPQCRTEFMSNGSGCSQVILGGLKEDNIFINRDNPNKYNQYEECSPYSPKTLK